MDRYKLLLLFGKKRGMDNPDLETPAWKVYPLGKIDPHVVNEIPEAPKRGASGSGPMPWLHMAQAYRRPKAQERSPCQESEERVRE
jgi:hypothetical protein